MLTSSLHMHLHRHAHTPNTHTHTRTEEGGAWDLCFYLEAVSGKDWQQQCPFWGSQPAPPGALRWRAGGQRSQEICSCPHIGTPQEDSTPLLSILNSNDLKIELKKHPSSQCTSNWPPNKAEPERANAGPREAFHQQNSRPRENKQTGSALCPTTMGTMTLGKARNRFTMCLLQSSKWLHLGLVFPVSLLPSRCYLPHFHDPSLLFFFIFQPVNADYPLNPVPGPPLFPTQFWAHLGKVTSFLLDMLYNMTQSHAIE